MSGGAFIFGYLVSGLIFGFICVGIASSRGMSGGFLWGFFLGVIGVIIVAVRPNEQNQNGVVSEIEEEIEIPKTIYRFRCKSCGKKLTGWYQTCPQCRSSGSIERLQKEEVVIDEVAAAAIKAKQLEKKAAAMKDQAEQKASTTISEADEIKKFKDLLDSGIITQEEFDAKKKQLLGL